jgi:hypothetical protein
MAPFFLPLNGNGSEGMVPIEEVFHMDSL